MIPKISFRYSGMLDKLQRESLSSKIKQVYPSSKDIMKYRDEIKLIWAKKEKEVLKAIQRITGLKWKENLIKVYIKGKGRCFADPLTLCMWSEKEEFIDVLTHELIHQMELQNMWAREKWLDHANKTWKKENTQTKTHIFVHAVHYAIYIKLFNESRLKRNLNRSNNMPDYKRSWEIIEEEGYKNIIKSFRKLIK